MDRMDYYEDLPEDMRQYLRKYGWHFSPKLCEYASERLQSKDGKRLEQPYTREKIDTLIRQHGVDIKNDKGLDAVFVANMLKACLYPESITDEAHLIRGVRAYLDGPNSYDGKILTQYFSDCIGTGKPLIWGDFI